MELQGYVVLGPDYFFGDAVTNHTIEPDRQTWIDNARKPAIDAFPAWLDAVKGRYGTWFDPVTSKSLKYVHDDMCRKGEYQVLCCRYVNEKITSEDAEFL